MRTDADGRFEMSGGGEDSQSIFVTAPSLFVWRADLPKPGREAVIRLPEPAMLHIRYDIEGAPEEARVRIELRTWDMPEWKGAVNVERWVDLVAGKDGLLIENLPPGVYDISRIKHLRTAASGTDAMLDRNLALTLESGKTAEYNFVRSTGAPIRGEIIGLPDKNVDGVFVYVKPVSATGDPRDSADWKLPTFDGMGLDGNGQFTTERIAPGQYKIIATAYRTETPEERGSHGWRLPTWIGASIVTVPETGEPPRVRVEMKPYPSQEETARAKAIAKAEENGMKAFSAQSGEERAITPEDGSPTAVFHRMEPPAKEVASAFLGEWVALDRYAEPDGRMQIRVERGGSALLYGIDMRMRAQWTLNVDELVFQTADGVLTADIGKDGLLVLRREGKAVMKMKRSGVVEEDQPAVQTEKEIARQLKARLNATQRIASFSERDKALTNVAVDAGQHRNLQVALTALGRMASFSAKDDAASQCADRFIAHGMSAEATQVANTMASFSARDQVLVRIAQGTTSLKGSDPSPITQTNSVQRFHYSTDPSDHAEELQKQMEQLQKQMGNMIESGQMQKLMGSMMESGEMQGQMMQMQKQMEDMMKSMSSK